MQSLDINLVVSNGDEHSSASLGIINSSEVHRVMLANVYYMPRNMFTLISDAMRRRLNLDFNKTFPPQYLNSSIADIIPYPGPYQICEDVYLSVDPINYKLRSIVYPTCVPNLPVDFVLGTLYFDELELRWNSKLNRLITRSEEEEEMRRQTYRNIL